MMKVAIVIFPGSNCDHDMFHVIEKLLGIKAVPIWHKDALPLDFGTNDWVILPGGFSYGDYLRCGALASFSLVMQGVKQFAERGGKVLGVCNGFQILCESKLLPGALLRNSGEKFICKNIYVSTQNNDSPFTKKLSQNEVLKIPIAHAEGRYYADQNTLDDLEMNNQILFKYCNFEGNIDEANNPNGALNNIAGICNKEFNVFGMMPHPERAAEAILGNDDGMRILSNILEN